MNLARQRSAWLHRLAWIAVALVISVTSVSAFIRLSNAGLGCSDWPECYGSRLRAEQQHPGIAVAVSDRVAMARLTHRGLAVSALLVIAAMVGVCFGRRPWLRREGVQVLWLLALAIGLAILGRWTATSRLPAVTVANLVGGLVLLALAWRLAAGTPAPASGALRKWAWAGVAVLLADVVLGAMVSASHAGPSCRAWGDCFGAAAAMGWPWGALDPWREPIVDATSSRLNPSGSMVQLVHRVAALLAILVLIPLGAQAMRGPRRWEGVALWVLLALQLGLGGLMVVLALPMSLVLAHNLAAGLLLATALRLTGKI
jgi:cytochrome c oxidase assembly protein subunit 15